MALIAAIPKLPNRPPKPYIRPTPKIEPKRAKAMTIAAAFKFKDGILLCADTEQTQGELKYAESKLIYANLQPSFSVVFAIAGSVRYATMAVQEIIADLKQSDADHETAEVVIKARISKIYNELLYPHPRVGYSDSPFFDLLIGIQAEGTTRLLACSESSVSEIFGYECFGIGLTLAKYLIKPLYHEDMHQHSIEMLATRVLVHVKDNVAYCGKDSEFVILRNSGEIARILSLQSRENIIAAFDGLLPVAFFSAGDLDAPDEDVLASLNLLGTMVIHEREKARQKIAKIKNLAEKIF
jgi:20S proteasome alpha/beta subunit